MQRKAIIGIDPAFRKDGFHICILQDKQVSFYVFEIYEDFIVWLVTQKEYNSSNTVFAVENSNSQNTTFARSGANSIGAQMSISRKAGKNQAVSEGCLRILRKRGFAVQDISPQQKGKKLTDAYFRAIMRSNGHSLLEGQYKGLKKEQDKIDSYQIAEIAERSFLKTPTRISANIY